MSELSELYQEVILDHNRRPRNFQVPEGANRQVEGFNPLCGDRFTIYLRVEDGVIRDAGFQGAGCAISKASASLMTDGIKGRTLAEADRLFEQFHQMVTSSGDEMPDIDALGKLAVFAGVRDFPMRVKCA
ncbi:MAG TPA: SUF system NifU family Fe-S cluster assembly protein, partial [Vicinamibacterales bacterium]|nr:SUF system NifU family Fe-S cluster assembly protein [Vicinamibacterales bacterium]